MDQDSNKRFQGKGTPEEKFSIEELHSKKDLSDLKGISNEKGTKKCLQKIIDGKLDFTGTFGNKLHILSKHTDMDDNTDIIKDLPYPLKFKNKCYAAISHNFPLTKQSYCAYKFTYCSSKSSLSTTFFHRKRLSEINRQKSVLVCVSIFCADIMKCFMGFENLEKGWSSLAKLLYNSNNLGKTLFERFWIVTPETFEEARNHLNSSAGQQLGYIVFHPGDCRLFVQIPVLIDSYLGRKSELGGRDTAMHYIQMGLRENLKINKALDMMWHKK